MDFVKNFFNDYGYSFLMMIITGAVIALILELTIKMALNWLENKLAGHEKALAIVAAVRIGLIQTVTWLMVACFTNLIVSNMPLPGGVVFYPVWLCLVYIIQYVFSVFGIKGLIALIKRRAQKAEEKANEPKPEKKDPLEGMTKVSDNLWTDGNGGYFILKGRKVVKV